MNPAALKADLHRLETGGTLIVNDDAFDERNLDKAGYRSTRSTTASSPTTGSCEFPMTSLTKAGLRSRSA